MNGPEHHREAERLLAEDWLNADIGWKGSLSAGERLTRQAGAVAEAQVHATLALADVVTAWIETLGGRS